MNIRRCLENEADVLTAIAHSAKASWPYTADQIDAWSESLTIAPTLLGNSFAYVAEVNSEVAGFYVLCDLEGTWCLEHLWVLPNFMRQGIGTALLTHARSLAIQQGATTIAIDSEPYAEQFYLAYGAQRVGVAPAPIEGHPDRLRTQLLLPTQWSISPLSCKR